jgi:hypothetical protein
METIVLNIRWAGYLLFAIGLINWRYQNSFEKGAPLWIFGLALIVGTYIPAVTKVMVLDQVQWQGPSCLAIDDAGNAVTLGEPAEALLGKEPRGISVKFPFHRGAVVNEQWGEQFLQILIKQKVFL